MKKGQKAPAPTAEELAAIEAAKKQKLHDMVENSG